MRRAGLRRMRPLFVVLVFFFCMALWPAGFSAPARAGEGQVPLLDADGLHELIQAHAGAVVVVNFWATWCGPCRVELPHLVALRQAYSAEELFLTGVSLDFDRRAVDSFAARERPGFPLYFAGTDIPRAFAVGAIPKTMIWAPDGTLVMEHVGVAEEADLRGAVEAALGRGGGD